MEISPVSGALTYMQNSLFTCSNYLIYDLNRIFIVSSPFWVYLLLLCLHNSSIFPNMFLLLRCNINSFVKVNNKKFSAKTLIKFEMSVIWNKICKRIIKIKNKIVCKKNHVNMGKTDRIIIKSWIMIHFDVFN